MKTFAFLAHPLNIDDVAKKYKIAKRVSPKLVGQVLRHRPPLVFPEIEGIVSATGEKAVGWFVIVPLLPWQFTELKEEKVLEKLAKACKAAKKEGAKLVGLGAFTAMVGNGGAKLAEMVDIPVTTGNTYTTTTAIQGTLKAVRIMDIEAEKSTLAIIGATGSIGRACAEILAPKFANVLLVGRNKDRLDEVAEVVRAATEGRVESTASIREAAAEAEVIITVTGAVESVIEPRDIKSGAVVCDVARPRDVSKLVSEVRNDVLVIDGGIVKPPGKVDFKIDFGPPPGLCEGCVGETIILALEGRYENYTVGKNITVAKVAEMASLAAKHGFELAGLRRFETLITSEQIEEIKANVNHRPVAI